MCTCLMALRVLLADESSTIKKVMQLALQDFGVEVKAVPLGVDVVQVAKSFKPDIIFADILLAKMTGYEVSRATKSDSMLKHIPVVLMWSSFMELDENKARESKADHRLEKPFDAETLRALVRQLVPATQDNAISQFLTFPDLPAIIESERPAAKAKDSSPFDLEEPEEFQAVPLAKNSEAKKPASPAKDDWSHQDLSRYKINLLASDASDNQFRYDEADLTNSSIALSSGLDDISLDQIEDEAAPAKSSARKKSPSVNPTIDAVHAQEIIRQEARKVLEAIAWKMIPDVVERVVREELAKLLKDAERL